MQISYNKLQEYFDKKLPVPDKVAEFLTFYSYEVEGVEEKNGDYIFDIDVLPNRASDSKDEEGVAKELSAVLNIQLKLSNPATKFSDLTIDISVSQINKLLGSNMSVKEVEDILNRLLFRFDLNKEDFVISPPVDRKDIELRADVIEEVGRIYGYENIKATLPEKSKKAPRINKKFYYVSKIKNFFVDEGFSEVYTYTFRDSGEVEMIKPFASDKNFLRADLRGGLEKALEQNIKNLPLLDTDEVRIFEIGNVFSKDKEHTSLAFTWSGKDEGIINKLSEFLGVKIEGENTSVNRSKLEIEWSIFETNFDELLEKLGESPSAYEQLENPPAGGKDIVFSPISPYPFVLRDIAVWVPKDKTSDDILNIIKKESTELLVNTKLFDKFEKDDKVSYAFNLVFQAQDKTLSDDEVNKIMDKIKKALNSNPDWEVR
jgi:phenylalanyl-tRNA synthetase beta chain